MRTIPQRTPGRAVMALCLSAGVVAGCGSTQTPDPSPGAEATQSGSSPEQTDGSRPVTHAPLGPGDEPTGVYAGAYDEDFHAGLSSFNGQQVSLTGEVRDLIRSRSSFELASPTDPDLDPLLVSAAYAVPDLQVGDTVEVTGTVREGFEPPVVEEAVEKGEEAGFYDQHLGQPWLDEAQVEIQSSPTP